MSSSRRAGSVNSTASAMVTPGISPTVSTWASRPAKTSAYISWRNSWLRGPQMKYRPPYPYGDPGRGWVSGRDVSLLIMSITSIRNPSTPRSSHHRIMA